MSFTFPDTVSIIPVALDYGTKSQTLGVPVSTNAYVENYDTIRYDMNGNEYRPETLIGLPAGTSLSIGDKVQVTVLHGMSVAREAREVKEIHYAGAFKVSHMEVFLA